MIASTGKRMCSAGTERTGRGGRHRRSISAGFAGSLIVIVTMLVSASASSGASSGPGSFEASLSASSQIVQACDRRPLAGSLSASACTQAADEAGTDAFLYGIPLMEFERQALEQTSVTVPNDLSDAPLNELGSAAELDRPTPGHQVFVQPNVDTLYTMGHLDLARGPLVLHVPRVAHHRYYVFQFLDPYTNTFAYVGTRTTGDGAGNFLITGPGWRGRVPRGMRRIAARYDHIWLCGRTLVNGPADLPAVHRIQRRYKLIPLAEYRRHGLAWRPPRPRRVITRAKQLSVPTGLAFYVDLDRYMKQDRPPPADDPVLKDLARFGVGPGLDPRKAGLSAAVRKGLAEAADGGIAYITSDRTTYAAKSAVSHHGWFVPGADTGNFGTDYEWRAIVAVYGLAANEPVEAMYIVGVLDGDEQKLNGADDYVIHFPAGHLPPARYFWSLTMYDSEFSLVPNAIDRYALANHIPGLRYNRDGSLTIYLQHAPPPVAERSNWLPAPASGEFEVTLRLYGPTAAALDGKYSYPTISRASG